MKYRDKIQWLHSYRDSLRLESVIVQDIEHLQAEAKNVRAVFPESDYGEYIETEKKKLLDRLEETKRTRDMVYNFVENMPSGQYKEILYRRYILGQKWEDLADDMHIDISWVLRLHQRIINKINPH